MAESLDKLRARIRELETYKVLTHVVLPFEVNKIDSLLPEKGLTYGALHEVTGSQIGADDGAATLFVAGILARTKGPILWCQRQRDLFAPALTQVGLDIERIVFVEAPDEKSLLACFEEGLRHKGIAAVVGEISKLSMTESRRLQLAAEGCGAMGIALKRWCKHASTEVSHNVARTSWRIQTLPSAMLPVAGVGRGKWLLELERCHHGEGAHSFAIEACDEKGNIAISADMVYGPSQTQISSAA